jgi:YegS/Rv2252/BmrU family lipid kinase
MPTEPIWVILNPSSGGGDGGHRIDRLKRTFPGGTEILAPTEERDPAAQAREALRQGARTVVAAGGDGTVSAVASALVGTRIPLGIIPLGTANAFAGAMGIPEDLSGAWAVIREGHLRTVDTGTCNDRRFVLMANLGVKVDSIREADPETKSRFGMLAYLFSGLVHIRDLEGFEIELTLDGETVATEAAAVTVANAAPPLSVLAQGPAKIPVDDGLLDVTVLSPDGFWDTVTASAHLLRTAVFEEEAARDDIASFRARRIVLTPGEPRELLVDGEPAGETPAEIECVPASLHVLVPGE